MAETAQRLTLYPTLMFVRRSATGKDSGLSPIGLGQQIGAASVNLAQGNLPPSAGGTSIPFGEDQPSLGIKYIIRTEGIFPSGLNFGTIGTVVQYAGTFAPGGWMEADGQLLDIAENDALFSLIGTTYGGDGATTFALPISAVARLSELPIRMRSATCSVRDRCRSRTRTFLPAWAAAASRSTTASRRL